MPPRRRDIFDAEERAATPQRALCRIESDRRRTRKHEIICGMRSCGGTPQKTARCRKNRIQVGYHAARDHSADKVFAVCGKSGGKSDGKNERTHRGITHSRLSAERKHARACRRAYCRTDVARREQRISPYRRGNEKRRVHIVRRHAHRRGERDRGDTPRRHNARRKSAHRAISYPYGEQKNGGILHNGSMPRRRDCFQSSITMLSMTTGVTGTSSYHPTDEVRTREMSFATDTLSSSTSLPKAA